MRPTITMKLLAAALLAATPLASQADGLRIPFTGSLEGGGRVVTPGIPGIAYTADYWARCGGGPVLETEAAGSTSLLGLVDDFQSHCLLPPEVVGGQIVGLPFSNGRFRFTDTNGRYIEGQYRGKATPTVASKPPPPDRRRDAADRVPGSSKARSASAAPARSCTLPTTVRPTAISRRAASPTR